MTIASENRIIEKAADAIRYFHPACSAPCDGHSGRGHYVWSIEYPEDGSVRVGPATFEVDQLVRVAEIVVGYERAAERGDLEKFIRSAP